MWLRALALLLWLGLAAPTAPRARPPHPSMIRPPLQVQGADRSFWARQVPGDGACLFHALAAALRYEQTGEHPPFDKSMYDLSARLRQLSVDVLECADTTLHLGGCETITTSELVSMAAQQYNTTAASYCEGMRLPAEWGGGPEIVALANLLRLPIHVYELRSRRAWPRRFELAACAQFGSPLFDEKAKEPIYILCVDGRFPDITPGQENSVGDHFMPLFSACDLRAKDGPRRRGFLPGLRSPLARAIGRRRASTAGDRDHSSGDGTTKAAIRPYRRPSASLDAILNGISINVTEYLTQNSNGLERPVSGGDIIETMTEN